MYGTVPPLPDGDFLGWSLLLIGITSWHVTMLSFAKGEFLSIFGLVDVDLPGYLQVLQILGDWLNRRWQSGHIFYL